MKKNDAYQFILDTQVSDSERDGYFEYSDFSYQTFSNDIYELDLFSGFETGDKVYVISDLQRNFVLVMIVSAQFSERFTNFEVLTLNTILGTQSWLEIFD